VDDTKVLLLLLVVAAIVLIGVAVVMLLRFWRLRKQLESLGAGAKFAFWGAVIYTVLPIDVLPDPIVLDDIGVLAGATLYLHKLIRERDARRRERPVVSRPARPAVEPGPREAGRRRI
jgi:uncharacterized membrane protein YkvA (DUF1232 family)